MNGPSHYREAERLLTPRPNTLGVSPPAVALAAVHATLALAAATVVGSMPSSTVMFDAQDWRDVIGVIE